MTYQYIGPWDATKVRVFKDPLIGWVVDAGDEWGGYTRVCWKFPTWEQAVAAIPAFVDRYLVGVSWHFTPAS